MKTLLEKQKLVQQIAALLLQLIEETVAAETVPPSVESEKPIEMLTIKECAEAIKGVSEYSVRELVRKEKIPYIRAGQGKNGKILISKAALLSYLEKTDPNR